MLPVCALSSNSLYIYIAASLQSQPQVESPNVSGSSGIEDASCDDDNQRALASLGIGDAVHTDATTAAAINAVDSHANGTTKTYLFLIKYIYIL